jgi:hypothetical protein
MDSIRDNNGNKIVPALYDDNASPLELAQNQTTLYTSQRASRRVSHYEFTCRGRNTKICPCLVLEMHS